MNGQLYEHPLAELIHEIAASGLSGSLRLSRERIKVAVYFEEGGIVYATSNLRLHRLSECARRWNIPEALRLAATRENISDMELGLRLVSGGDLSREEFEELLARQAVEVLRPALLWTDGSWDFDPRVRLTVEVQSRVEVKGLLMETARRLPPDFVVARFKAAGDEEKLSPVGALAGDAGLLPVEGFILSRVDAPLFLTELAAISGMPEAETLQALYALVLGGFLCRARAPHAFTSEQVTKARAIKPAGTRVVPAQGAVLPEPATPATEVKETHAQAKAEQHQQNDVNALFARLDDAENYYQVLDLSRDAEASEIKRAYHGLAKRFHPDRFHKDADPSLYARIEDSFARISQAYETLKDQQMRASYDRSLGATAKAAPQKPSAPQSQAQEKPFAKAAAKNSSAPPSAPWSRPATANTAQPEELYQMGMSALQQGNQTLALSFLGEATRLQPKTARYHAQYGRALAAGSQSRHQAEAEFKVAIALDKNNVYYRVMLARLYAEMGMPKRAQSELERALAIDPHSESARLMLDKLKGKG